VSDPTGAACANSFQASQPFVCPPDRCDTVREPLQVAEIKSNALVGRSSVVTVVSPSTAPSAQHLGLGLKIFLPTEPRQRPRQLCRAHAQQEPALSATKPPAAVPIANRVASARRWAFFAFLVCERASGSNSQIGDLPLPDSDGA
jgi:hypothetical protein